MKPLYPEIEVNLSESDGNAFSIQAKVIRAMRHANVDRAHIENFKQESRDGDYDHLLLVCMEYVNVT